MRYRYHVPPPMQPCSPFLSSQNRRPETGKGSTETETRTTSMAKKAVLIGCNYPGTKAELKGCINDVRRMHSCLVDRYGFSEDDITIIIDTDDSYRQPTSKNIRCALSDLIRSVEPGDILFVHYSGHDTRLPAETSEEDDTGYNECIVPCDMNLITGGLWTRFQRDSGSQLYPTHVTVVASSNRPRSRLVTAQRVERRKKKNTALLQALGLRNSCIRKFRMPLSPEEFTSFHPSDDIIMVERKRIKRW